MNNWQSWVVGILLLLCAIRIGRSIYSFFHRSKESGNPCDGCASGCELKDMYDEKHTSHSKEKKQGKEREREKKKKSCCG